MNNQKTELYFLFFLLAISFVLTFFIFQPFLYALLLAVIFTTVFAGIHKKILDVMHQNKGLSALLSTILVGVIVITPLYFLITQMFREATGVYASVANNGGLSGLSEFITAKVQGFSTFIPNLTNFSFNADQYVKNILDWLLQNLGFIFSHAISIAGSAVIFIIALYYLFKDGKELRESIVKLSPLENAYNEKIFSKLSLAIKSVVMGSLLIAVIQGILASVGFAMFGIPNVALWGSVTAIAALIPGFGTPLVIIPAAIFLFFKGNILATVGFLIWGLATGGIVDNFLKPQFIKRGMLIHPFLILLSALGGIIFFGPLGFLLGPLVLGLLFVLLEIYSSIHKENS